MQVSNSYSSILKIALPVIAGNIAQTVINVTDTAFLGRVNETVLAASAIGGVFYLIFTLVAMGLAIGPQVVIARRTGEENDAEVGPVFNQGFYLLALFGLLMVFVLKMASQPFLRAVISSEAVFGEAMIYLDYRAWGVLFASVNMVYRALYVGLSRTSVLTTSTVLMAIVNIILNYCFIFGKLGFPEMGIAGSALASVLAEVTAFVYFTFYSLKRLDYKHYKIFDFSKWDNGINHKILKIAYPTVFQHLVSIGAWFLFFVIIEQVGQTQLAASNVIRSLLMLFMMPVWGLATTINTMVGNIMGQQKTDEIRGLTSRIIILGYVYVFSFIPLLVFKPEWLILMITNDQDLVNECIGSLYVVYVAHFIFIPAIMWLNILIGAGDTRTAFIIEAISIIVYLGWAWFSAIYANLGLLYIWMAEPIYWIVVGVLSFIRMKQGKWKLIAV